MNHRDIADILRHGEIEIVGRITASSNQALLVDVTNNGTTISACYKTEIGERPLWDFPDGLWRREVAAWVLSDYLGLDLVPMTVSRLDGPYAPGSLQLWVGDATDDHYFTLRERADLEDWFRRLCLFDLIANNSDRKAGHVLFDTTRCWAIDNGLCFAEDDKVRTVVWDFAGNNFSTQEISTLTRTADVDDDLFGSLLTSEEIESIRWRAHNLLEMGAFPEPDEDGEWPPYPWPLV